MIIEKLNRQEQQFDDRLTTTTGLLSLFFGYVAYNDCYKSNNSNVISCAVLLYMSVALGLYTGLKVSHAWQSCNVNRHQN